MPKYPTDKYNRVFWLPNKTTSVECNLNVAFFHFHMFYHVEKSYVDIKSI